MAVRYTYKTEMLKGGPVRAYVYRVTTPRYRADLVSVIQPQTTFQEAGRLAREAVSRYEKQEAHREV